VNDENHSQTAAFIWSVADLLRGDFKQSQYGRVILPFTLLRRMECVLEPTREKVLAAAKEHANKPEAVREKLLLKAAGQQFYNTSALTLARLSDTQTLGDLNTLVQSFSTGAGEIFEHFHFEDFLDQLNANNLLYQVVQRFAGIDLSPKRISNFGMGLIFEELIRRFAESSNETAGEHFTPRDIVHLTTSLVLTGQDTSSSPTASSPIYDPTAGTGGFLSEGDEYIQQVSEGVDTSLHGQELNPESYAICKADMLIKGQVIDNIKLGNTLSDDQHAGEHFDFMLSNPPFGVEWKKVEKQIREEHQRKGFDGRFGPGLPRVSDGSLLFLMHLVSKMRDAKEAAPGSASSSTARRSSPAGRAAASPRSGATCWSGTWWRPSSPCPRTCSTTPASPPTSGCSPTTSPSSAGQGAAHQRHPALLQDAQVARQQAQLPGRQPDRRDRPPYGAFKEGPESKIFPTEAFGYRRITVERPLRLNFQASPERIERLSEESPSRSSPTRSRRPCSRACAALDPEKCYRNREAFTRDLKKALKAQDLKLGAPQMKALLNALSERDPEADICTDKHGNPEPDTSLRDNENVPLGESVFDYFEREVKPHVPDAWIDESKRDDWTARSASWATRSPSTGTSTCSSRPGPWRRSTRT
jgi:type I restriction enzyme M protein